MSDMGILARREAAFRDALMAALLPAPGGALPAIEDVDLRSFWLEFDDAAPIHLPAVIQRSAASCVFEFHPENQRENQ